MTEKILDALLVIAALVIVGAAVAGTAYVTIIPWGIGIAQLFGQ